MNNSSKGQLYRMFEQNFGMEYNLKTFSPKKKDICKIPHCKSSFTSGNWEMAWKVFKWKIMYTLQLWSNWWWISFFFLECKSLENRRKNYLCKYYYQNPNIIKFNELMSSHEKKMLEKLRFFIVKIYDSVCTPNPYFCHY